MQLPSKYCAIVIWILCSCHPNIVQLSSKHCAIVIKTLFNLCQNMQWPFEYCATVTCSRWRNTWAALRSWPPTCASLCTTFSTRGSLSSGYSLHSWSSLEYSSGKLIITMMNEVFLSDLLLIEPPPNIISYRLSITTFKKQFQPTILPYHTLSTPLISTWRLKIKHFETNLNYFHCHTTENGQEQEKQRDCWKCDSISHRSMNFCLIKDIWGDFPTL